MAYSREQALDYAAAHQANVFGQLGLKELAPEYAAPIARLPFVDCLRQTVRACLYHGKGQEPVNTLEIGSGTGYMFQELIPKEWRPYWTQLDVNPSLLRSARTRTPSARIIQGSAYDLPFPDGSFDLIIGLCGYSQVTFLERAFKEVNRCLRPRGRFAHIQDMSILSAGAKDYKSFLLGPRQLEIEADRTERVTKILRNGEPIDVHLDFLERLAEASAVAGLTPAMCGLVLTKDKIKRPKETELRQQINSMLAELGLSEETEPDKIRERIQYYTDILATALGCQDHRYYLWDRGSFSSSTELPLDIDRALGLPEQLLEQFSLSEELIAQDYILAAAAVNVFIAQKP